jgi:predicted GIY-YIG superfamily endonuclease
MSLLLIGSSHAPLDVLCAASLQTFGVFQQPARGLLVRAYAENISANLLEQHGDTVKTVIGKKRGVYVLSKDGEPYYIGLANKLPSRLKHHLKDRHARKWDRFNFYAIRSSKFVKDLESILIRVAKPKGNRQKGNFGKNKNLRQTLRKEIIQSIKEDFNAG